MRFLCLFFFCCSLSQLVVAQSAKHKSDYYVLADSSKRHPASIKLFAGNINIEEPGGRKHTLYAANLAQFQSKGRRYYTIKNFEVKPGNSNSSVKYGLAELLDSGQVSLLSYEYTKATLMPMLVSGTVLPGIGSGVATLYLLRPASSQQVIPVPSDGLLSDGPRFRATLQPFLAGRPDLLNFLLDKRFNIHDLPDIIRALNTNQPYVKTILPVGIN